MIGWAEVMRHDRGVQDLLRRNAELSAERLSIIKKHFQTKPIHYPQYQEAFDYVNKLYPYAAVRSATIYHASREIMDTVGYNGVGGFYDTKAKVIVITERIETTIELPFSISAQIDIDEVVCHELIHYAANYKTRQSNRAVEEEIAYGKSVGYLRQKGHSDDFIIRKNMMPYLVGCVDKWKVLAEVFPGTDIIDPPSIGFLHTLTPEEFNSKLMPYTNLIKEKWIEVAYKLGERIIAANTASGFTSQDSDLLIAEKRQRNFLLDDDM